MEFGLMVRYLVGLLYAAANGLVIWRGIVSFKNEQYGFFGFFISQAILVIIMMARVIFGEL